MRSITDTYNNFTIIDTNNPSSQLGLLNEFSYYAANIKPFRFVLVDGSDVVKWVSEEITPPGTGAQSWTPLTPVYVEPGWNLGLYFVFTGTVPFNSPGAPAQYEPNNAGKPEVGDPLSYAGSSNRIYSFVATGEVAELPSVPTIIWPANGAYMKTATLTHIDWADSTGTFTPLEYKYEAYGNIDYTGLIYSSIWLSASEILTPGSPENEYYIRVRAKDSMGYLSGWSNDAAVPYKITVDNTPPVVTITTPAVNDVYILGETVLADWSATDALSGIASAIGTVPSGVAIDTNSVGAKEFTVTAIDNAGNTTPLTVPYTVIYEWDGFRRPVDNLPTVNEVKAGRAIPVKFSLNGDQGLKIFAVGYPKSVEMTCGSADLVDEIVDGATVSAGGSSLNYDAYADQYIYVWKTNIDWAGGTCRQLVVKLIDGTSYVANFKFK